MTIKLGIVMDPINNLNLPTDSTLAIAEAALQRDWKAYYFEQADLLLDHHIPCGFGRKLVLKQHNVYAHAAKQRLALSEFDIILMRKDPPCDAAYWYTIHILERAEQTGVIVANSTSALRAINEKLFVTAFPQCCPPTLVSASPSLLRAFLTEHHDIVCKPLHGKGGEAVFHLHEGDPNTNVILAMLTRQATMPIMAQRFIPAIREGDKRILLINGTPVDHALLRRPHHDDWRGNLAAGASGHCQVLSARDYWLCDQVGPVMRKMGVYFTGLDVIGDYLTEINVTSPTGIREINPACSYAIADTLLDVLCQKTQMTADKKI